MKQIITTKKGTTYERNWDVKSYYSNLNIRIDTDTMCKFKKITQSKGLKYSDVLRQLIQEYIRGEANGK